MASSDLEELASIHFCNDRIQSFMTCSVPSPPGGSITAFGGHSIGLRSHLRVCRSRNVLIYGGNLTTLFREKQNTYRHHHRVSKIIRAIQVHATNPKVDQRARLGRQPFDLVVANVESVQRRHYRQLKYGWMGEAPVEYIMYKGNAQLRGKRKSYCS